MNGVLELLSRPNGGLMGGGLIVSGENKLNGDSYNQIGIEGMMSGNGDVKPSTASLWPNIVTMPTTATTPPTTTTTTIANSSNALHKMLAELTYNASSGGSSSSSGSCNSSSNTNTNANGNPNVNLNLNPNPNANTNTNTNSAPTHQSPHFPALVQTNSFSRFPDPLGGNGGVAAPYWLSHLRGEGGANFSEFYHGFGPDSDDHSLRRHHHHHHHHHHGPRHNNNLVTQQLSLNGGSLVLDTTRGELVNASKMTPKELLEAKALAASKSHSEAERRRRERINTHLGTLRTLLPSSTKTDKASLLAEVIEQVKTLKRQVSEIYEYGPMPTDHDELCVEKVAPSGEGRLLMRASLCCDDRPDLMSDLKDALDALSLRTLKAEISTLGGRIKNVFIVTVKEDIGELDKDISEKHVQEALRLVMDGSGGGELSPGSSNKRHRVSTCES